MHFHKEIACMLESAGITKGSNILVHSSYKSFGKLDCTGPDEIIKGLLSAVGDNGTVLFPTLSFLYVNENNPIFDVDLTRSCTGFLSEYFRLNYSQGRSLNPTHSVAGTGRECGYFLDDHLKDSTSLGANSPYRRLLEKNGKIIMFGCGTKPNTSMHAIEELVSPPYLFDGETDYKIIDKNNVIFHKRLKKHGFKGYNQRYDRIDGIMPEGSLIKTRILESETYIIDCEILWAKVEKKLREDPFYFVERL